MVKASLRRRLSYLRHSDFMKWMSTDTDLVVRRARGAFLAAEKAPLWRSEIGGKYEERAETGALGLFGPSDSLHRAGSGISGASIGNTSSYEEKQPVQERYLSIVRAPCTTSESGVLLRRRPVERPGLLFLMTAGGSSGGPGCGRFGARVERAKAGCASTRVD